MSKVCSSAFVDSRFGCNKTAKLDDPNHKFETINAAIKRIIQEANPKLCHRWVIFLSPCKFREDVILEPFIDLHGLDRTASLIIGDISAQKLTDEGDHVELKEFTLQGSILKNNQSLGSLSIFELTLLNFSTQALFKIEAGQVVIDSCILQQNLLNATWENVMFYHLYGTQFININTRNCRHERFTAKATKPNQIFSNILFENSNSSNLVSFQSNLFFNSFEQHFNGLLIPYLTHNAAGFFQSHSDTLRHNFEKGAGNGTRFPTEGQTYDNAFILTQKVAASGKDLEVHIHTTEVLNLPRQTLSIFSSTHTLNSGKAKTKHIAWQNLNEVPEAIRVLNNTRVITATKHLGERSIIGAASDDKLFAGRLVLGIFPPVNPINNPPPPNQPAGPVVFIPDGIGVVDVEETAVLVFPFRENMIIGQQITFNFINGLFFVITTQRESDVPGYVTSVLRDLRVNRGKPFPSIVYSLLDINPPRNVYPNEVSSGASAKNTTSVTFTLTRIDGIVDPPSVVLTWTAVSIPGESQLINPGTTTLNVPSGTTTVRIIMWAAGGSGGPFTDLGKGSLAAGGGGAGGATILYNASAIGLKSLSFIIPAATTAVATNGGSASVSFNYLTRIDTFTALGGLAGGIAINNSFGTDYLPAAGGLGQGVVFFFNNQSTVPPPDFTTANGTNGGAAGGVTFNSPSKGFEGESHPLSGEPGGIGGTINGFAASGPGGGGAGYQGSGGSGGNFSGFPNPAAIGVAGPFATGGGGGAGQGPTDIPGVIVGASGGALVTFI